MEQLLWCLSELNLQSSFQYNAPLTAEIPSIMSHEAQVQEAIV